MKTQRSNMPLPRTIFATDFRNFFAQRRLAPVSIVLGLHLILLGLLLSQAPLRQAIGRLIPASMIGVPLTKMALTPAPISPPASDNPNVISRPANTRTASVSQAQAPQTRVEESQIVTPVASIERDFPANHLSASNVPNPVTEQREELAKPATIIAAEPEKNEVLRIGEMDNNVIVITKLGSSIAEYIAPNFLHAQLEQTHFQVKVGDFEDIETALVNQIITQIRTRYPKEIYWNSKIKARMIRLSMLPQDHAELEKFLKMEIFGKKKVRDYSFWDKSKF